VSFAPFPQLDEQTEGDANVQEYPAAAPVQPKRHSDPSSEPSSQSSGLVRTPFPQMGEQTEGVPVQPYPASTKQEELHPSPFAVFPSSHCSETVIMLH